MNKTCKECNSEFPENHFHINGGHNKDGTLRRRPVCRICVNAIDKLRYANSPDRQAKMKNRSKTHQEKINKLKLQRLLEGCFDCRNDDIRVLEFDHRPNEIKLFNIAGNRCGLEKLTKELNKCDVVCANCHRIRTYERDNSWKQRYMDVSPSLD